MIEDEPEYTCAIWYLDDHGQIDYQLATDEQDAAKLAAWAGDGATLLGLQRSDGSTVLAGNWPAFADARRRLRQSEQDLRDNPPPPVPTRQAQDPFDGRRIDIETTEPEWLGFRRE